MPSEGTWDLRLRVLGNASPGPADAMPGVVHFAATDAAGRAIGVASVFPENTPWRPGRRGWRIRGMAVEPGLQRSGVGRAVLGGVLGHCRAGGAEVVWANGRDGALGFYERLGFAVVGDGFLEANGIPHHVVILDLLAGAD